MKTGLLLLLLLNVFIQPVYANAGVWRYEPAPGFHAVPVKSSSIIITTGSLTYDVDIVGATSSALVTAAYKMQNTLNQAETVSVAFPYIGMGRSDRSINVLFNGREIENQRKLIPNIRFELQGFYRGTIYTYDEEGKGIYHYDTRKVLTYEEILKEMHHALDEEEFHREMSQQQRVDVRSFVELILFELTFEPDSVNDLEISFIQDAGGDRTETRHYTYIYHYFLEPARYWKDFEEFNIRINLPKHYRITKSTLELTRRQAGTYEGYFAALPEKNLEFEIYRSNRSALLIGIILFVFVGISVWFIKRSRDRVLRG